MVRWLTNEPPGAEAITEFNDAFKRMSASLRRLRGREAQQRGALSHAQYTLLWTLSDGQPHSLREIAVAADVSAATATEMLDSLSSSGLVCRTRSAEDRRVVLSELTPEGTRLVDERRDLLERRWRACLGQFSDGDLHMAAAVLDAVHQMFEELSEERPSD
jgi:DNA-binding MarR family transcriptional regulator